MNQQQIKALETQLWDSANSLRANSKLTAAEYKDPLLGLILLRYAQNRLEQAKLRLEANLTPVAPGRVRTEPSKDHFWVKARWMARGRRKAASFSRLRRWCS